LPLVLLLLLVCFLASDRRVGSKGKEMVEDALAATRGVHNVEAERTWDAEEYKLRALERQDRESGVADAVARRRAAASSGETFLQGRGELLNFEKDVGKSRAVAVDATGAAKSGYFCQVCQRTFNDSSTYMIHLNSAEHNAKTGMSMAVKKSSLEEVRQALRTKIAIKYGYHKDARDKRSFEQRVRDAEAQTAAKKQKRQENRQARKAAKQAAQQEQEQEQTDAEVMAAMGFGGFGGKKR